MQEDILWAQGLKRTRPRQLVLEVLREAQTPLAAPDISVLLERRGTPVWLSTVYRVLDTFVEHGMLYKTAVLDNGTAVYELGGAGHRHYAVCLVCHRVIPLEGCPLESYRPRLEEAEFTVTGHRLQMFGVCGQCQQAQ